MLVNRFKAAPGAPYSVPSNKNKQTWKWHLKTVLFLHYKHSVLSTITPYYLTGKEENVAHPSRVIKWIVQVQCGISCVAAVLSHCRVLADKTKGYLTSRVLHLTCWNINLRLNTSEWLLLLMYLLWIRATSGQRLGSLLPARPRKKPHTSHEKQHACY